MEASTKYRAYMKYCTLLFILLLFSGISYSQPCLPNGITFGTQAEVDAYPVNYPGCEEILGDVYIHDLAGSITDLSPLNGIRKVHGNLTIMWLPLIDTLNAFPNLTFIGQHLSLGTNSSNYNGPTHIEGFNALDTIISDLWVNKNYRLRSLQGFSNLRYIGGDLNIKYNPGLKYISAFSLLNKVEGDFVLSNNDSIEQIPRLNNLQNIGDYLLISDCAILMHGDIFSPMIIIRKGVYLSNNPKMISLPQLGSMSHVDGDIIVDGLAVDHLGGFETIKSVSNKLEILSNDSLLDLSGLDSLRSAEFIWLHNNDKLQNLTALGNLDSAGDFRLNLCPKVKYLSGLQKLESVNTLRIESMDKLFSLGGLQKLREVKELRLYDLPSLNSLSGLDKLEMIQSFLLIRSLPLIQNLDGLESVSMAPTTIEIDHNNSLNSLDGIESWNIDSLQNLFIWENPALSECAVESICAALWTNINTAIVNNASGCNSVNEVQQECIDLGLEIEEIGQERGFYPNPITPGERLYSAQPLLNARVSLYNADGRRVSEMSNVNGNEIEINTGTLIPGLYILEIAEEQSYIRIKLVMRD